MDAEAYIIAYLGGALNVPVSADVPADRPEAFVTVEQTGASYSDHALLERPSLAIQSWAGTRYEAAALARRVHELMVGLRYAGGPVCHVSATGPYNFPSPDGIARYQGAYDLINHR